MKNLAHVIEKIQFTEKGTAMTEAHNKYVFRVASTANKMDIKRAVEQTFDVQVAAVNTMCYHGKRKRERSMQYGKRADWKRAVVTLKEGSQIDLT